MPNLLYKILAFFFVMLSLIISGGVVSSVASAKPQQQVTNADELQTYLQRQMETYKIPGMAIAIVREGEVEYMEGFGVANAAGNAVTPDTPFLLASVSKSITAVGIMQQ